MNAPVIKGCAYVLVHVPDLVRYGSKPLREIRNNGEGLEKQIEGRLRDFNEVVSYPPNQVFIGNISPEVLKNDIPKPWYRHPLNEASRLGKRGEIVPEEEFYAMLKVADDFDLLWFEKEFASFIKERLQGHVLFSEKDCTKLGSGTTLEKIKKRVESADSLPLYYKGKVIGCFHRHHDQDESLRAEVLMENLATKASGALVMKHLLKNSDLSSPDVDFIISCSEEAVGDRYNRGGGSMAKAIGEMCESANATGPDIKAFCAGPIYAIIQAASLVRADVFRNVVVVGGGSLAKLGMKFKGHLKHDMPILEDVLGGIAVLIGEDNGIDPIIRLDCIGKHDIGAGSSQQAIMESLVVKPLTKVGKRILDIDKFSTELHNPEITEPSGGGNVPENNYRMIAALAVMKKEIGPKEIDQFIREHGMPGFSPTQGHIPAAVPFLGHAIDAIKEGRMANTMFIAKGSLFLGRMSQLSDGMSFMIEKNPGITTKKGG